MDVDYPVADVEMLDLECWAVCLGTSAGNKTLLFIYPALWKAAYILLSHYGTENPDCCYRIQDVTTLWGANTANCWNTIQDCAVKINPSISMS